MKFGVQHGIGDSRWTPAIITPTEVKRFAQTAERVGYDAIAFTDHPAPSNRWVESGGEGVADLFTSLAFCAAVTERVRLMSFVLMPNYRNPFLMAHAVATLDHLSAGRVTLGLGTGYLKSEYFALGTDPAFKRADFEEALEVARQVWAGQDVTYEGRQFSARGVRAVPASLQTPHPPLYLHGNTDWGLKYAVQHCQGWMGMLIGPERTNTLKTKPIPDLESMARRIDDVRAECDRVGRDIATLEIVVNGNWGLMDIRKNPSAEQMRDEIGQLDAMGVTWQCFNICGDDPDASIDTLKWVADAVIA